MNIVAQSEGVKIPLRRFRRYREISERSAAHSSRLMFPDLRGFTFLHSERNWLESNNVQICGVRIGVVASSGHRIMLNDELHHTLLLPIRGMIAVEQRNAQRTARTNQMLNLSFGERTTTVGENFLGIVIQIPYKMLEQRSVLYKPDREIIDLFRGDQTKSMDSVGGVLSRQASFLVEELDRSNVLLQSERLANSAIDYLADLVVEYMAATAEAGAGAPRPVSVSERLVFQAEDIMRANLAEPVSISEVATDLGVSTRALQLGFRRFRNTSPSDFLASRRLERAREKLLAPRQGDSVTSILFDCGVTNPGRFAGLYRSVFGELPSATLSAAGDRRRGRRRV